MVARVTLHNMRQDRDETVRGFGARFRGQASACKFVITWPGCNNVNYTEEILRNVLTRGIADPKLQLNLFGDKIRICNWRKCFNSLRPKKLENDRSWKTISFTLTHAYQSLACETAINTEFSELFSLKRI